MKFTKSEKRVIDAITQRNYMLVYTKKGKGRHDKNCDKAIDSLKQKGIIFRNPKDCLLYLTKDMAERMGL
jgi:hypothetical protein